MLVLAPALSLFSEAAAEMELGALLAGCNFLLQEAMSALVIMDSQMDNGVHIAAAQFCKGSRARESSKFSLRERLICILDEILCAEHGWRGGLSLVKLNRFDLQSSTDAALGGGGPLHPLLVATVRVAASTRTIVLRGDIHEEEDFSGASLLSGLVCGSAAAETDLISLLNRAEEHAAMGLRELKAVLISAGSSAAFFHAFPDAAATGPRASRTVALAEAVLCRIRHRRGFCGALLHLSAPSLHNLEVAKRMLSFAQLQLSEIAESVELGVGRDAQSYTNSIVASRYAARSMVASNAEMTAHADVLKADDALVSHLRSICSVGELRTHEGHVRWMEDMCGSVWAVPCLLTRSAAQLCPIHLERFSPSLSPRSPAHPPRALTPR